MAPRLFRLKVHDCFQIEVKFDYPLHRQHAQERFLADLYLFVPPGLDVNPETYTKERFYEDVRTYTRYATPKLTVSQLLDPACELSPFARLVTLRPRWAEDAVAQARAVYELRMLACIFRAHFRDASESVLDAMLEPEGDALADAARRTETVLDDALRVTGRLRELARENSPALPATIAQAWSRVDEAISLRFESVCGKLARALSRAAETVSTSTDAEDLARVARRLAETMRAEEQHRARAGYPSQLEKGAGKAAAHAREQYLQRMGALKKYTQSILFLSVHAHQASRHLLSTLYAFAAMVAMAFFVIVLWLLSDVAPMNSLPYILLAVVGYAFKDRIKESLKQLFSARMTGLLRDREGELLDRREEQSLVVGSTAEAFSFVPPDRVPPEVRALHARHHDELMALAEEGAADLILQYQKSVTIHTRRVFQRHQRVSDINEILRFGLRHFLYHMDEPEKHLLFAEPLAAGDHVPTLAALSASKVYPVTLVLGVHALDAEGRWQAQWEHFRLILTRNGIERVESEGQAHFPPPEPRWEGPDRRAK